MYVSKLRGGVLIKFDKLKTNYTGMVGDPAPIVKEGITPQKNDKGTNKLQSYK